MNDAKNGILALFGASLIWGLHPIYWRMLRQVSSEEILAHRIIWSAVLLFILLLGLNKHHELLDFLKNNKRERHILFVAAFVIGFNWWINIWGINHGRVVEASLGYFMNPLVSVFLATVFLHEKLRRLQKLALLFALAGLVIELVTVHMLPLVAIGISTSFGFYGLLKKSVKIDPLLGLLIESSIIAPFALMWIYSNNSISCGFQSDNILLFLLLAGTGIVSALPLILFSYGAQRVPLITLGFMQYVCPIMTFTIGTLLFHEHLSSSRCITFIFIWIALMIFSFEATRLNKKI